MIYIHRDERAMLKHMASTLQDAILSSGTEWEDGDQRAVNHVKNIGELDTSALVITGEPLHPSDAYVILGRIVDAEMANWVPEASQRLILRASNALGFDRKRPMRSEECGPERGDHALINDWVGRRFLLCCVTCHRLYLQTKTG